MSSSGVQPTMRSSFAWASDPSMSAPIASPAPRRPPLRLLDYLRRETGRPIPLAWTADEDATWRAIEVYPAATRIAHGAADQGGSLMGLDGLLDCSVVEPSVLAREHTVDACVCVLAAADFLRGRAVSPPNLETALLEGWIWAPGPLAQRR